MKSFLPALIAIAVVGGGLYFLVRQMPSPTPPVVAKAAPVATATPEVVSTPAAVEVPTPVAARPRTGGTPPRRRDARPTPSLSEPVTAAATEAAEIHVAAGAPAGGDGSPANLRHPRRSARCGHRDPRPSGPHSHRPGALPRAPRIPTHRDRLGFRRAAHRLPRATRRRHAHLLGRARALGQTGSGHG